MYSLLKTLPDCGIVKLELLMFASAHLRVGKRASPLRLLRGTPGSRPRVDRGWSLQGRGGQ